MSEADKSSSRFPPVRVRSSYHFLQVLKGNVCVDLGASDPRVSQDRLDMPEVRAVTKHVGRYRVAGRGCGESARF